MKKLRLFVFTRAFQKNKQELKFRPRLFCFLPNRSQALSTHARCFDGIARLNSAKPPQETKRHQNNVVKT